METPEHLLGDAITQDYVPSAYWGWYYTFRKAPPFSLTAALEMLTDPRINLGLWLIKGPILSKTRFYVDCDNPDVKEFLKTQITRFWRMSSVKAMKAVEWGYGCSEALYKVSGGMIHFDTLKDLHSLDCRAITQRGRLVGASVRNTHSTTSRGKVWIEGARCLWTVHSREVHQWYGRSRMFGAYLPWLELWTEGGAKDTRRLFYHKYAYTGPTGYHPVGNITLSDGTQVSSRDLMREMLEKFKTGAVMTFPNTKDAMGHPAWEVKDPQVMPPPTSIMQYIADLRTEILEGMGIPPEVIETVGGSTGWSGKAIPMEGFYSILQDIVNWLAHDLQRQILRPLVDVNFDPDIEFEVVPFGLSFAPSTPSDQTNQAERVQGQTPSGESYSLYGGDIVEDEPPRGYKRRYGGRVLVPAAFAQEESDKEKAVAAIGTAAEETGPDEPIDMKTLDIPALALDAKVDIEEIDLEQLRMGMEIEQEHNGKMGADTKVAYTASDVLKIAVAHLREIPEYYSALKKMEKAAEKAA